MIAVIRSRFSNRLFCSCAAVLAGCLLWVSPLVAEEPPPLLTRAQWEQSWKQIAQVDHLRGAKATDLGESIVLWMRALPESPASDLSARLWHATQTPKEDLEKYVNDAVGRLGRSDAVDFRFLLTTWGLLNPLYSSDRSFDDDDTDRKFHNWLVATVAAAQVKNWCQHPENAERMVWFCAWRRSFSSNQQAFGRSPNLIGAMAGALEGHFERAGIKAGQGNYYWKCARTFVFLACATNRSDLFAGRKPSELKPQFDIWLKWFRSTHKSRGFRASQLSPTWVANTASKPPAKEEDRESFPELVIIPTTPFPGWRDLPMAPTPVWFRDRSG